MGTSAFQHGTKVHFDNKCYILLRKVTDELWQLEDCSTKRIHEYTDDQLRSFYASGQLTFANFNANPIINQPSDNQNYLGIPPTQWEKAKIRRAYVMATLSTPNTKRKLKPVIYNIWSEIGKPDVAPNPATVIRWKNKFVKAGNDITSLIERHDIKGNRSSRYPQEVIEFVQQAIDTVYLTSERDTIEKTCSRACTLTENENELRPAELKLPIPARRLVKSMIEAIPAFDRCVAREGRAEAVKKFRSVLAHHTTLAPLESAEIDHTQLDLMVIDDETYLPLGRPWVTACIDDYTRCILGIHIGFDPPSFLTVAQCLKDAFCPKVNLKEKYPIITNTWDAHGVMRELVVDNGNEFHSKSLENACFTLGIEIHYSARKTPWFKGKIERFLKTFNDAIAHGTPGTTFRNIFEKKDYDSSKHAVVRKSTLQAIARKWIVDVYHQRPHRTLKIPPAIAWKSSIKPEDWKTAFKFCQFYNKRAFKFSSSHRYHIDIVTHENFLAGKFNALMANIESRFPAKPLLGNHGTETYVVRCVEMETSPANHHCFFQHPLENYHAANFYLTI